MRDARRRHAHDEDVLQAAKELAEARRTTAGKVISALARQALSSRGSPTSGSPITAPRAGPPVRSRDRFRPGPEQSGVWRVAAGLAAKMRGRLATFDATIPPRAVRIATRDTLQVIRAAPE